MNVLKVVKALIACCLCVAAGTGGAQAQFDFCSLAPSGQMLYYKVLPDSSQAVVTHPEKEWPYYAGNKPVGDLLVPSHVQHNGVTYTVVGVGENAFYRCDSLTSCSAKGISYIGTQSFCGCTMLETIELCDSLQRIDEGAFAYCRRLARLSFPSGLSYIGISAFSMCEGLMEVRMTAQIEQRCDALTFYGCPLMQDQKNRKNEFVDGEEYVVWKR